jgi:hypothetical protein
MIEKRELFPSELLIKRVANDERWQEFMNWINQGFIGVEPKVTMKGDIDAFYGLMDDCPIVIDEYYSEATLMTLDAWYEIYIGDVSVDIEMIETYNGEEHPLLRCVQLHEDSNHGGQWALRSDCTHASYNGGYGLCDEVNSTKRGGTFIEGTEDEFDIVWSDHDGEYMCTEGSNVYYGYVNSRHQDYFHSYDAVHYDGETYYDSDVAREHGIIWSERHDEYMREEDLEDDISHTNAGYHDLERINKFDSKAKFTIGFEIEKEDSDAGDIHYRGLYEDTQWIKERDGSLDDYSGYYLVSPAFNLYDDGLDKDIKDRRLIQLINGNKSDACGGHINVASKEYNTEQLFEGLSGFFPLLYSLYNGRITKTYSKAKMKHKYYDRDKYSAIFIKDHVVEFRIFSAVKNVNNLLWRRDLMRIMCENVNKSEVDVLRMLLNHKSKLYKHLRLVYSQDALIDKIELFVKNAEDFNNKKLPKIIRANIKKDNLETTNQLGA